MNLSKLPVYAKFLIAALGVIVMVVQQVTTNGVAHIDWGPIIPAAAAALGVLSIQNASTVVSPVAEQVKALVDDVVAIQATLNAARLAGFVPLASTLERTGP